MDDPCDYPAAHSMDTMWFAVDRDGHVAAFESGEAGAVPDEANLGEDYDEVVEAIVGEAGYDDIDDIDEALFRRGVYLYQHDTDNWVAGPYVRARVPETPARATILPRAMRKTMVSFDGRFADTEELQPVELWPSSAWGAAYLASDRKTVRPIPGAEERYAEEVAHVDDPDLIITPLGGAAPQARVVPPRPWWKRLFGIS